MAGIIPDELVVVKRRTAGEVFGVDHGMGRAHHVAGPKTVASNDALEVGIVVQRLDDRGKFLLDLVVADVGNITHDLHGPGLGIFDLVRPLGVGTNFCRDVIEKSGEGDGLLDRVQGLHGTAKFGREPLPDLVGNEGGGSLCSLHGGVLLDDDDAETGAEEDGKGEERQDDDGWVLGAGLEVLRCEKGVKKDIKILLNEKSKCDPEPREQK